MAFNLQLADRVRDALMSVPNVEEKRMMGGLVYMVNGKMCVGVEKDRLMCRINPDVYEQALTRTGCRPMDFTGKPMKGYVFVSEEGYSSQRDLESWVSLCLDFNAVAKPSKKKK